MGRVGTQDRGDRHTRVFIALEEKSPGLEVTFPKSLCLHTFCFVNECVFESGECMNYVSVTVTTSGCIWSMCVTVCKCVSVCVGMNVFHYFSFQVSTLLGLWMFPHLQSSAS